MTAELPSAASASHAAARSVSAIAFNQIAQVAGSVLFVALVPRRLGTEVYGQLAFAFALITIFQMLGELGYQEIFGRFLPEVRQRAGQAGVRAMARSLFWVKAVAGLALGLGAGIGAQVIAGWLTPGQAWLIGLSVAARVWAMGAFPLLLGLGETFKWSVETTWRQIIVTGLTLVLVRDPSLTLALAALAVHEIAFLLLGLWWVRNWFSSKSEVYGPPPDVHGQAPAVRRAQPEVRSSDLGFRIWDLLRFGSVFSLANFALVVMFRISPITVEKLTGSHPETGFFDLALGGLLLVYTLLGQVAYAFVPILTQLHLDQQPAEAEVWLGRFVRYATLLVAPALGGMWAVAGPVAPVLFGEGFEPAANTIRMMAFGLLPLPIAWAGVALSTVEKHPLRKVWAALTGLAVFLVAAGGLRGYASAGIALAFGLALLGYTLGFGQGARRAVRAGGIQWGLALGATSLFSFFLFFSFSSLLAALTAWAGAAAVYGLVIVGLRVVRLEEVNQIVRAVRR